MNWYCSFILSQYACVVQHSCAYKQYLFLADENVSASFDCRTIYEWPPIHSWLSSFWHVLFFQYDFLVLNLGMLIHLVVSCMCYFLKVISYFLYFFPYRPVNMDSQIVDQIDEDAKLLWQLLITPLTASYISWCFFHTNYIPSIEKNRYNYVIF